MEKTVTFEEIEENKEFDEFNKHQNMFCKGFVRCQPGGSIMPRAYPKIHQQIQQMTVREDDIFVCSFQKSGTTWTQEMVWNIIHGVDLEAAQASILDARAPFLELSGLVEDLMMKTNDGEFLPEFLADSVGYAEHLPSPRIIKTHLPVELLPDQALTKPRLIYVSRNPRDVVISLYNHWQVFGFYKGDFDGFLNAFLSGVCGYYCPYMPHITGFWNKRHEPNILFITYEEMKQDITSVIRKTCSFLGKPLNSEQIEKLAKHLQFDAMKDNPAVNKEDVQKLLDVTFPEDNAKVTGKFMRKGQVGDWMNKLTSDQLARMEKWEEDQLQGSDFKFTYSL